jgi:hypothetical protein
MTLLKSQPVKRKPSADSQADGKPPPGRRMTEEEFVAWVDDKTRAEWVDGEVIVMAPVSIDHDKATFWTRSLTDDFVEFHQLGVVTSDVPVRLPKRPARRAPDVASFLMRGATSFIRRTSMARPTSSSRSSPRTASPETGSRSTSSTPRPV